MKRTALTLALPGGVSERSAEVCLQSAFDEGRSPASLSALIHKAGKRAGELLQKVDHSVLGKVVQAHPRIQKLAERFENQLLEMLTFLNGIAQPLADLHDASRAKII